MAKYDQTGFPLIRRAGSLIFCVEGEKERQQMMQNEDKTRLFTIVILHHMIGKHAQWFILTYMDSHPQ